jgi:hypothetical protein
VIMSPITCFSFDETRSHIFIGYSTLNVSIYSENRRGIYVHFQSPSFGPQKTITTWLTKTEIFTQLTRQICVR